MRNRLFLLLTPVVAVTTQVFWWSKWVPSLDCYLYKGECVYQWQPDSNVYFEADLKFAAVGLAIGLIVGISLAKWLWQSGVKTQLLYAVWTGLVGYVSVQVYASTQVVTKLDENHGLDIITLRSPSLILALPFAVQLCVFIRGHLLTKDKALPSGENSV